MSIAWTASRIDSGTTCLQIVFSSPAASDLLLAFVNHKYPSSSPNTPSGWTRAIAACGGLGSNGVDSGSVMATLFYKIADGTEGTNTEQFDTAGNSAVGIILGYRATSGSWSIDYGVGYKTANANTVWSASCLTDIGLAAGDVLFVDSAINSNTNSFSAEVASNPGVTVDAMTERGEDPTTQGQDMSAVYADATISAGTSTGCPVFVMTSSGSSTDEPAGVSVFVRIREVTAGKALPPGRLQAMGIIF